MSRPHAALLAVLLSASALGVTARALGAQPPTGSIVYVFEAGAAVTASDAGLGLLGGVARKTEYWSLGASLEVILTPSGSRAEVRNDELLGETTCKNRNTGDGVTDAICRGLTLSPAVVATLESTPFHSVPFVIGAGYRVGRSYGPVATMALSAPQARSRNRVRFVMMAGPSYFSARLGVMIPER